MAGRWEKKWFLKVVQIDAISLIRALAELQLVTFSWSGVHDGEAGGSGGGGGGGPGEAMKMESSSNNSWEIIRSTVIKF